ncbi:hypothetical protein PRIC2_005559 [Phytophthora ramorum]
MPRSPVTKWWLPLWSCSYCQTAPRSFATAAARGASRNLRVLPTARRTVQWDKTRVRAARDRGTPWSPATRRTEHAQRDDDRAPRMAAETPTDVAANTPPRAPS